MDRIESSPHDASAIVNRYKSIGLFGGLFLGGVIGIMVAGPRFDEWSAARSALTILGSFVLGGLLGYIAGEIAVTSFASGPGSGIAGSADGGGPFGGHGHGDGHSGGDGGGSGGDGRGGGGGGGGDS